MAKKVQSYRAYYAKKISLPIKEKEEIDAFAQDKGVTVRDIVECAVFDALFNANGTLKSVRIIGETIHEI